MKKKTLLLILSILSVWMTNLSFSIPENDTERLYLKCLKIHIEASYKEKSGGYFSSDIVNIISNEIIDLPDSIGKYKLRIVDDNISSLIINKAIHVIKLFPIKVENSNLVITLGDYVVRKGGNGLTFAYGGGMSFYFRYDCSKKRYAFLKSKVLSF